MWCGGGLDVAAGKPEINYLCNLLPSGSSQFQMCFETRVQWNNDIVKYIEKLPAAEKSNNGGSGRPLGKQTLGSHISSKRYIAGEV